MKISSILTTKGGQVITISPSRSLAQAVSRMAKYNIGALVVTTEDDKVVGILSERDILRRAAKTEEVFLMTVGDVMTKKVIVGVPQDDLMTVAHTMTEGRFRHLPVMDGDRLVGIISIGDVLKAQRDKFQGEIDTLETQILAEDE